MMMSVKPLLNMTIVWYTGMLYYLMLSTISAATTRLRVTAPMNPVNSNTILSIHCQIWNLKKGDQVQMLLNVSDTHSKTLTVDEAVLSNDERVFLAVRTMHDGSRSYFLSVTGVTLKDEGNYECKLFRRDAKIAEGVVPTKVNYFPDGNPICSSNTPSQINAGALIRLNCSSEIGSPEVQIKWTRTRGNTQNLKYTQKTGAGVTYAELETTLGAGDKSEIFVCEVSSPAIPGEVKTCIIGPITVINNKNDNTQVYPTISNHNSVHERPPSIQCNDMCSSFSSPVFQWVIASVIAGVMAVFFCILGVILYIKYNKMYALRKEREMADNMSVKPEGIYDEVDVKPYMTLQRQTIDTLDKDMQFVGYYRITPKPILGQI